MTWDELFFELAKATSKKSRCFSRQIGSVLVRNNKIISTGYNGPPRGMSHCDVRYGTDGKCPRQVLGFKSGEGLHLCAAAHSERNTLLNAASEGISTKGTKIYMTCGIPCKDCLIELIQAEVEEVICTSFIIYDELTKDILKENLIQVRLYDFLEKQDFLV